MSPKGLTAQYVLTKLEKEYTPPRTFLHFKKPYQLLVATILSAQCTDARVNAMTPGLFKKYTKPEDFLNVSLEELQRDIHVCGHYRNKAHFIQESMRMLSEKHAGKIPEIMDELLLFHGVGRKTAAVILYALYQKNEGLGVDTHVWRVAQRLGLSKANTQAKIELDLMKQTPRPKWGKFHTLLISHGRAVCTARNRKCDQCVFQKKCPSSWVMKRKDLAQKR